MSDKWRRVLSAIVVAFLENKPIQRWRFVLNCFFSVDDPHCRIFDLRVFILRYLFLDGERCLATNVCQLIVVERSDLPRKWAYHMSLVVQIPNCLTFCRPRSTLTWTQTIQNIHNYSSTKENDVKKLTWYVLTSYHINLKISLKYRWITCVSWDYKMP